MKKYLCLFLSLLLPLIMFCGCNTISQPKNDDGKLSIVTTIFPQYDFVREIAGDKVNLTMLLSPGAESHSYEPAPQDIIKIQNSDLFIYVGGESDEWVEDALKSAKNKDMQVINLMDVMGSSAKKEEIKEGMMLEEEGEEEEAEYDEHFWTSLKNAKVFCGEICDSLCKLDEKNADTYKKNLSDYSQKLDTLDSDFQTLIDESDTQTLIFGDRFPFRYLAAEYNLEYYAAFSGCSSESEPGIYTMAYLINKLTEPRIFYKTTCSEAFRRNRRKNASITVMSQCFKIRFQKRRDLY